ncbi:MAG TPA: response regulator [Candidatus Bathyarchaeia archaeon]|nr:response regulator [Candidatus Bathyarchaeia archaeon]
MGRELILTIDDDPDIRDVLDLTLSEYYDVVQAANGEQGLRALKHRTPSLIICDYMMPVMSGPEFCQQVKKDVLLRNIPIIMLTGKGEVKDMVKGIESGADDYLVKPFEPDALLARIRMVLRRTVQSLDANPLTHLPGNTSIMEKFQEYIDSKKDFAVAYADLDKFKIYNDKYGFEKGDEVIRETARLILEVVRKKAGDESFVGHIGGDDFVFIADNVIMDDICNEIIRRFDKTSPSFYNHEDRKIGFILGKDRQGKETKAGLLSISIGIVSNENQNIKHVAQIAEIGAELKKYAKSFERSNFVRNKRKS